MIRPLPAILTIATMAGCATADNYELHARPSGGVCDEWRPLGTGTFDTWATQFSGQSKRTKINARSSQSRPARPTTKTSTKPSSTSRQPTTSPRKPWPP